MSRIPLHTIETAPETSRRLLERAERKNGFVPNLLAVLAHAPAALETYVTVSEINARTSLSLAQRETVQLVAATTHGCAFCVAGHTAIARKGGLPESLITALREGAPQPDARLEALAEFTRAVIRFRGAVPTQALEAFRAAGYTDQQALEVVLGVALATLCNFANTLAETPLNAELAPYRWSRTVDARAA
ncbi:MAG: carboxymuconolactone decarboxylase family protein [Casimicrobiaceae bacterium]|nr:carboxymuconolactone decarboxylase family protein [Casimicrobiaceae bacterium]